MFRDMTGNTKFARCEGCGEPIFDRWDLLSSYLSPMSAMTIFLRQFSTSLIRFVMRLSDSSWHEDCLFCSQVSHLCLGVVFGGFYSSSFAKIYSRPRTCHFGCYRYSHFMTFWTSVWKSQRHVLTFSLWCPHILEIFWKSHDNVLHISVKCQVWDISWQS